MSDECMHGYQDQTVVINQLGPGQMHRQQDCKESVNQMHNWLAKLASFGAKIGSNVY